MPTNKSKHWVGKLAQWLSKSWKWWAQHSCFLLQICVFLTIISFFCGGKEMLWVARRTHIINAVASPVWFIQEFNCIQFNCCVIIFLPTNKSKHFAENLDQWVSKDSKLLASHLCFHLKICIFLTTISFFHEGEEMLWLFLKHITLMSLQVL